jgi:hypothetical protein
MKTVSVASLTTPLTQYTTVSDEATLGDAFLALEQAFRGEHQADPNRPRDFAVLVMDSRGQVLGRLTVWDVMQGLELHTVQRVDGLSLVDGYRVWEQPLANLATKARYVLVRNLVRRLPKHELIEEHTTLDQAIHQLLKHRSLSLIVTRKGAAVGVLRVVDVFNYILAKAKEARLADASPERSFFNDTATTERT